MKKIFVVILSAIVATFVVVAVILRKEETPERKRAELRAILELYVKNNYLFDPTKDKGSEVFNSLFPVRLSQIEGQYYTNCLTLLQRLGHTQISEIRINEPISPTAINIFIFKEDPSGQLRQFKGNCAYVGFDNIIICDANYIYSELLQEARFENPTKKSSDSVDPYEEMGDAVVRSVVRTLFLWVVGHEIGHIAHNHRNKHFSFDGPGDAIQAVGNSKDQLIEKEADSFAVDALGDPSLGFFFWMGLSQLAANPRLFGGKVAQDGTIELTVKSKTHPPLFLRIIENADLAIERGYVVDNTNHFKDIRKRIKVVPSP